MNFKNQFVWINRLQSASSICVIKIVQAEALVDGKATESGREFRRLDERLMLGLKFAG